MSFGVIVLDSCVETGEVATCECGDADWAQVVVRINRSERESKLSGTGGTPGDLLEGLGGDISVWCPVCGSAVSSDSRAAL